MVGTNNHPRIQGGGGGREDPGVTGIEQGVEGFGTRDTWGGGGAARDYRETMRNRERGKGGNPGVEEAGSGGGGVGNCG